MAQRRQHHPVGAGQQVRDQVGGGRPGRGVVEPDVGHPARAAHVGDQGDDRDAALAAPAATAAATRGSSGALSTSPWLTRPPVPRPSTVRGDGRWVGSLALVKRARTAAGRGARQRPPRWPRARRCGTGAGASTHDVDEQGLRASRTAAGLLRSRSSNAGLDGAHGAGADAGPAVEHPVDRGRRQPGLLRDVADPVAAADHRPIVAPAAARGQRHGIRAEVFLMAFRLPAPPAGPHAGGHRPTAPTPTATHRGAPRDHHPDPTHARGYLRAEDCRLDDLLAVLASRHRPRRLPARRPASRRACSSTTRTALRDAMTDDDARRRRAGRDRRRTGRRARASSCSRGLRRTTSSTG